MNGLSESEVGSSEMLSSSNCALASSTGSRGDRNDVNGAPPGNLRSRARAVGKPERYREAADAGPATRDPAQLKKKPPTVVHQKKSAPAAGPPSKGTNAPTPSPKNGSWSEVESEQFKEGCIAYGWGNWVSIERCVPTRSRNQVKSHAQKFQKHHPGERERLQAEFERRQKSQTQRVLIKKKIRTANDSNVQSKTKKRKLQRSPLSHSGPKEKSRRRSDPSAAKVSDRALSVKEVKILNAKKNALAEGKSPPIKKTRATIVSDTLGTGAWTESEQKQFEDAVRVHGWGNWIDVEACIPTRTNSQVKSHAQKYQKHKPLHKERLELDHKLYGKAKGGRKASARNGKRLAAKSPAQTKNRKAIDSHTKKNTVCVSSLEKVKMGNRQHHLLASKVSLAAKANEGVRGTEANHLLLVGCKIPRSVSTMKSEDAPAEKNRQKTTDDDYGAAKAILALNSAGWNTCQNTKVDGTLDLKQVSSEHIDSWEGSYNIGEEVTPSLEKIHAKKSAIVASSEEETSQDALEGKKVGAVHKSNEEENSEIEHVESKVLSRKGAPVVTRDACQLKGLKNSSQPPPHWLAADSWGECMDNIFRWNNQLTKKDQDLERSKYNKFTDEEKESMRKKLVDLMENQP